MLVHAASIFDILSVLFHSTAVSTILQANPTFAIPCSCFCTLRRIFKAKNKTFLNLIALRATSYRKHTHALLPHVLSLSFFYRTVLFPRFRLPTISLYFRHVRKLAKNDCQLCHVCLSAFLSAWNTRLPLEGFSLELIFNYSSKTNPKTWTKITGTSHEHLRTFMIVYR
jgi:hypothetical protein